MRVLRSESVLGYVALGVGLASLLGLGWSRSPVRLHVTGAVIWAGVAAVIALIELVRAEGGTDRRYIAAVALAVAGIALAEAAIVAASFEPCGGRCL